jgi:uncharacterized Zn-finger protein
MIDVKKLRNVECPFCDNEFDIMPSMTDEQIIKTTEKFIKSGNVTICHYCGAPLEFIPSIAEEWVLISPETMRRLPVVALKGLLASIISVMKVRKIPELASTIVSLSMLIKIRQLEGKESGDKTMTFTAEMPVEPPEDVSRN